MPWDLRSALISNRSWPRYSPPRFLPGPSIAKEMITAMEINLQFGIFLELAVTLWAIYSACINFFYKRITTLGLDAAILWLGGVIAGKENANKARENPRAVKTMATMMALVALGGIWNIAVYVIDRGWLQHP